MKLKNRRALLTYFKEQGYKVGAEVGTCYGEFAEKMYHDIPGLTLFLVDNWDNVETAHREKKHQRSVEWFCRNRLANWRPIILKMSSIEGAKYIQDGSLDFVYIDADHSYEAVKEDIRAWEPKVRKGGIVSGDDYYVFPNSGNDGVVRAVDEYAQEFGVDMQSTEWDNDNPERDERQPAWWFQK